MSKEPQGSRTVSIDRLPPLTCRDDMFGESHWCDQLLALWNSTFDDAMALSPRLAAYRLSRQASEIRTGWVARRNGEAIGFLLAGRGSPVEPASPVAWTDALFVHPQHQRQGVGRALLATAEAWARAQGCTRIRAGDLRNGLLPGVPHTSDAAHFFTQQGYRPTVGHGGSLQTLTASLAGYATPGWLQEVPGAVRPMRASQEDRITRLLQDKASTAWGVTSPGGEDTGDESVHAGIGRASDFMGLWTEAGVQGICRLIFEDSRLPIESLFPYGLPRPWGAIAGIVTAAGLSQEEEARALLIDAALRRLHNNGINGCIAGPTPRPDEFVRFGFEPYITYRQMAKDLI